MALSSSRDSTSPARYSTVALSLARFTLASRTPGTFSRALSTRPTQLAHVMPVTLKVVSGLNTPSVHDDTPHPPPQAGGGGHPPDGEGEPRGPFLLVGRLHAGFP